MSSKEIYNKFMNEYKNFAGDFAKTIAKIRETLPVNEESVYYNLGTMQSNDGTEINSNIILANGYKFKSEFEQYKRNNPKMTENEARARVVFKFLQKNGEQLDYQKNKDDILFANMTREQFYAQYIYGDALSNTNYYAGHLGNTRIISIETKETPTPRNLEGISEEVLTSWNGIPENELFLILYKRGLYHESVHLAMETRDERKCDTFALLKIAKEHPKHATKIFDIYNFQRSKIGYTVEHIKKSMNEGKLAQEIKNGTMTYVMPNTYKKLEQYMRNPSKIPDKDGDIIKLTCELTKEPEFSNEQLNDFITLISDKNLSSEKIAKNEIVKACMKQGEFSDIDDFIKNDKTLKKIFPQKINWINQLKKQHTGR